MPLHHLCEIVCRISRTSRRRSTESPRASDVPRMSSFPRVSYVRQSTPRNRFPESASFHSDRRCVRLVQGERVHGRGERRWSEEEQLNGVCGCALWHCVSVCGSSLCESRQERSFVSRSLVLSPSSSHVPLSTSVPGLCSAEMTVKYFSTALQSGTVAIYFFGTGSNRGFCGSAP